MNTIRIELERLISLFVLLTLAACSTPSPATMAVDATLVPDVNRLENESPKRILFIGNSYLYYNDSLHNHVRRIAEENGPFNVRKYTYKSATIGGGRLAHHPVDTLLKPGRLGVKLPFELVILQGGSMEPLTAENRAQFRESAIRLNQKIRATGAEVALYMTHAYVEPERRYEPNQIRKIRSTYVSVGNELDTLVIPVGLAFERAYEQRPEIKLHKAYDGSHPSLLGTYLAACVVYQSIYGKSVVGSHYDYFDAIENEEAQFLQKIAEETVRVFFKRD